MRRIVDLIRGASDFILATHFTSEIPPDDYILAMLERLHEEVPITRIVALLPDAPKEAYSWLNRFRNPDLTTRQTTRNIGIQASPCPLTFWSLMMRWQCRVLFPIPMPVRIVLPFAIMIRRSPGAFGNP
jgi:hypothetical protein